jgi:hypothetical protein
MPMSATASKPSISALLGEQIQRRWVELLQWDVEKTKLQTRRLESNNQKSRRSVLGSGPTVSLTTYGSRVQSVYLTIESIAAGSQLPSRLILWLDDETAYRNLPASLKRLQDRGLDVLLSVNYGPHTKYYPYLESMSGFAAPLATADDDMIYPRSWLAGLMRSYASNPKVVSCYRAHVMKFSGDKLAPYVTWGRCRSGQPSYRNFGTGVSGVLYPPEFLGLLKAKGKAFQQVCPKADDLWLHVNAIRAGYRIKQVHPWQMTYPMLPDTQEMGLNVSNVHAAQNDAQIQSTYTSDDLELIRSERS